MDHEYVKRDFQRGSDEHKPRIGVHDDHEEREEKRRELASYNNQMHELRKAAKRTD